MFQRTEFSHAAAVSRKSRGYKAVVRSFERFLALFLSMFSAFSISDIMSQRPCDAGTTQTVGMKKVPAHRTFPAHAEHFTIAGNLFDG